MEYLETGQQQLASSSCTNGVFAPANMTATSHIKKATLIFI